MKLYVCWGTFPVPWPRRGASWRPAAHPCKKAFDALTEAGHSPEVTKVYGLAPLPDVTSGRKEVRRLTGKSEVPVLVLDDGELIVGSSSIVAWARQHSAAATTSHAVASATSTVAPDAAAARRLKRPIRTTRR